ncbi:MAG TPA: hypothetical protein VHD85_21905 [Terracidiphilus sp.]|nr:hypothetical protein [Terracidiphilus sp.]
MRICTELRAIFICCLLAGSRICTAAQPVDASNAVTLAQKQITAYLEKLADLHCTETVTQEKLSDNGHVMASSSDKFDYLIMMSGDADDFQLNESRVDEPGERHKLISTPMLVTNGVATLLLVFHPYYRAGFNFETLPEEIVDGRPAIPIRFTHIPGGRTPAALALRGREYPLDLQGTAWLDKASQTVVKIEASLERDMSDVGLRSLSIHVEYKPETLPGQPALMNLPTVAVVDVATPRQRWRNTHTFGNYRAFSAEIEQDPNVKVHQDKPAQDSDPKTDTGTQGASKVP